jgi:hypothetical protein
VRRTGHRDDCTTRPAASLRTLAEVLRDYRTRYAPSARDEADFFRSQRDLRAAVRLAARARTSMGQRHPHQRRIPEDVLGKCEAVLLTSLPELRRAKHFDALFEVVQRSIGDIRGVGELTVYDTATRIGAFLRLHPNAVYLHAGVRRGARALGLTARDGRIDLRVLPSPLDSLSGESAEDILCIYKDSEPFRRVGERG